MMPESVNKGQSKKSYVSKTNNNNKPSQPNKPAVKVAAAEEVKVDKTNLANLVASLTEKISKMGIELQKSKAQKPTNTRASSIPNNSTTLTSTLASTKPKRSREKLQGHSAEKNLSSIKIRISRQVLSLDCWDCAWPGYTK